MKPFAHIVAVLLTAFAVAFAVAVPHAKSDEVLYVVCHPALALESGDRSELSSIFSARRQFDARGQRIVPLNLAPEDPTRHTFDRAVLGLSPDQVARYWIDQRIRGEARPPRQVASNELAVRAIARLPGAITYTNVRPSGSDVRIVAEVRDGQVVPVH
jgi:hypothetical protein